MSKQGLSYAFAFPSAAAGSFRLLAGTTVGYLSDSIFYRLDLLTGKAEAQHHPEGRSYQAFTCLHKRGMTVLADYGRNANLHFLHSDSSRNFQIKAVCPLEILAVELSLDGKYLAVACGSPWLRVLLVSVEERKVVGGSQSYIDLKGKPAFVKMEFNPANRRQLALSFSDRLELYEFRDCLESNANGVEQGVLTVLKHSTAAAGLTASAWDELNNIYISAGDGLSIWSAETGKELARGGRAGETVRSLVLTQKHIIVFYSGGRSEWLAKFYPELLDEDSLVRPFQLDRFHDSPRRPLHAVYDHQLQRLLLAYEDGFLGVLGVAAETNKAEEEEDEQEGRKKVREARRVEVEGSLVGPYHRAPLLLLREIAGTSLVVSVSADGRVVLWSGKQRRQVGSFDAEGPLTCADLNGKANVLAVGRQDGLVQFYSVSSFDTPFLFREFRLTRGSRLDHLAFSSSSDQLAVLSRAEDRIYYLLTALAMPFEVLGYVVLPHRPLSLAWHITTRVAVKPKHEHLLVCVGFGVLMVNGPAAVPAKRRGEELALQAEIFAARTDPDQHLVVSLPSGEILTTGDDKLIKKYRQPEEPLSKVDFRSKTPLPLPLEELDAHDLRITTWQLSGKWLVSGSADGSVQVRDTGALGQVRTCRALGWKEESVGAVGVGSNGWVLVGSRTGCLQVWKGEGEAGSDEHKVEEAAFRRVGRERERETKYFEVMVEEEYLERMKEVIGGKKKVQLEKLGRIRAELGELLAENARHDELERLGRDEFAIDLESRERVAQVGREKCLRIREESRVKILRNEVVAKKLKQLTWDRMEVHLKAINGLKNNFIVFNYQIRKVSPHDRRRLHLVFDLRRAQRKEARRRGTDTYDFYTNRNVVNGGVVQPLILGGEKREERKEEKGGKKKKEEEGGERAEAAEEVFNEEEWGLLYSAFELYCDNAKRNQIAMMRHLMLRIKETYNREFEKTLKLRQNQNELINDKNKRIQEICEELKRPNEALSGKRNLLETNDHVLSVAPTDIPFPKYLSREEREKAERERLKEEERQRKLAEDDASQRALAKMMGGTLEEKKTSVLEVTVEREKWMEKPLEEMSEEEKAKLKEYEVKRQKAEEEKERIVKKLEAELRKLRTEIDDIMEKYDEKLFALLKRKLEYDYRIEEQELYCTRLHLRIAALASHHTRHQALLLRADAHRAQLAQLAAHRAQLAAQEQELERAREAKHAALDAKKLGDIESKIKTIEKTIFEEYATNFKKRREMEEKLLDSDPAARNALLPLDPLRDIESRVLANDKARDFHFFTAEIKVLQQTYDIPEHSLMQILESRFNIRREESELDAKLKTLKDTLALLEEKQTAAEAELANYEQQLESVKEWLGRAESDLEIECRLKQGQVEVGGERAVPGLEEALLIGRAEIEEKNGRIMVNASEKIKVMEQIKTCKISVTEETLNLERKEELIGKLNAMIREIQMLKVKKEMQVALAKKDTKVNDHELKSLKEQIEKVRKEGEKRIALFEKKIDKINSEIDTIRKENKQLDTQKWNLEVTVKQREKIKEMMVGDHGQGDSDAKEKFEQIAINRKLFDRAKQQTEEIELLREELSKLKAKTFANFSNAQR